MASRQRRPRSQQSYVDNRQGRSIMRPIISTDVMGNRNVEIVPVGAWVEPADDMIHPDAVLAARREEEKIRILKEEKENRLKSFQQEVKQRVSKASRMKRQHQIQEAEKAFELERRVIQQSCLTGEMPRRDTCSMRQDLDLAIKNRLLQKYGEDISTWGDDEPQNFNHQSEESHQESGKARQQLVSKRIAQDTQGSGGGRTSKVAWDIQVPTVRTMIDIDTRGTVTKQTEIAKDECSSSDGSDDDREDDDIEKGDTQKVQFSEEKTGSVQEKRKKKKSATHKRPVSARLSSILVQNSESDVLARQRRQQTAVSRRIFMDREREAVRENLRRQEHRKKIVSLKKQKEEYRQQLEALAHKELEPVDPVTGETPEEARLRERLEAMQLQKMVDRRRDDLKRAREMERYLDALRHSVMEKVARQGIQLPALCACGDSLWDTHPETCANNCFFYKNNRAYARALQSLLSSAEVM